MAAPSPYDRSRAERAPPPLAPEFEWPQGACTPPDIDPKKEAKYLKLLLENANALAGARFGPFWGDEKEDDPKDGYDKAFFRITDVNGGRIGLNLLPGKKPSEAFKAIRSDPTNWHLDCGAFSRLCLTLACEQWVGAKKFDEKFNSSNFYFSQLEGSATITSLVFRRLDPEYLFIKETPGGQYCEGDFKEQTLIDNSPVGTLFLFRNGELPETGKQSFRFEHAIRLGPDLFVGHGLPTGKHLNSLAELRQGFAAVTHNKASPESLADYTERVIWVQAVHYVNTHLIAKK